MMLAVSRQVTNSAAQAVKRQRHGGRLYRCRARREPGRTRRGRLALRGGVTCRAAGKDSFEVRPEVGRGQRLGVPGLRLAPAPAEHGGVRSQPLRGIDSEDARAGSPELLDLVQHLGRRGQPAPPRRNRAAYPCQRRDDLGRRVHRGEDQARRAPAPPRHRSPASQPVPRNRVGVAHVDDLPGLQPAEGRGARADSRTPSANSSRSSWRLPDPGPRCGSGGNRRRARSRDTRRWTRVKRRSLRLVARARR